MKIPSPLISTIIHLNSLSESKCIDFYSTYKNSDELLHINDFKGTKINWFVTEPSFGKKYVLKRSLQHLLLKKNDSLQVFIDVDPNAVRKLINNSGKLCLMFYSSGYASKEEVIKIKNKIGLDHGFCFEGDVTCLAINNKVRRYGYVYITGDIVDVSKLSTPNKSLLTVISVFNEVDVIEQVVNHLLLEGSDVHVVDNWSTDGSYEAIKQMQNNNPRLSIERFPKKSTGKHEFEKLLNKINEVARSSDYDWVMHCDSDEIRSSPWPGINLKNAVGFVDQLGYNAVDFTVFDFVATRDGFRKDSKLSDYFTHGDFGRRSGHFIQIKLWKNNHQSDLATYAGHQVLFPGRKVFPIKFMLSHFPYRSNVQAMDKVFKYRRPRLIQSERKKGWNTHYDLIDDSQSFIKSKAGLVKIGIIPDSDEYILQRLTGSGIEKST